MKISHYFILSLLVSSVTLAEEGPSSPQPLPAAPASGCQMAPKTAELVCKSEDVLNTFMCVNTPPGGVKEDFVILRGRFNLQNSVLNQLSIALQHEYTKKIQNIPITIPPPLSFNCWFQKLTLEKNFCLENNGVFSIYVPLPELGPYTLFMTASNAEGGAVAKTVRVSRVIAAMVTPDVVLTDPVTTSGLLPAGTHHVQVTLDLLKGCGETQNNCDFIGSSTGGVHVTVSNQMSGPPAKAVHCETNTTQGGSGHFVIGVPVQAGENRLEIHVCNAAQESDSCPKIQPPPFRVGGEVPRIEVLPPLGNGPFLWEAAKYPAIPLRFKIAGLEQKSCDDSVQFSLNTELTPHSLCAKEGIYEIPLQPEYGYNVVMITAKVGGVSLSKTVTFGWGRPLTPFKQNGEIRTEEERKLKKVLQFGVTEDFLNKTLLGKINQYLATDDFRNTFGHWTEDVGRKPASSGPHIPAKEMKELPYCKGGGSLGALRIKVMEPPQIGKMVMRSFKFGAENLQIPIDASDVSVALQLYKDENGDAIPDMDPLPLRVAFKSVHLNPILQPLGSSSGKTLWQLTSPYTDCDYKREGACLHMPALLSPDHFEGSANRGGAFAVCDHSQTVSEKMDTLCHDLNVLDRQTGGLIQEKILDAINRKYVCEGSSAFNSLFQNGFAFDKPLNASADYRLKGKVGIDELQLSETGMLLSLYSIFGGEDLVKQWPAALRTKGAGILVGSINARDLTLLPSQKDISFGISLPLISQLFWGLTAKEGGPVSITVDENLFQQRGFDFEECCRAKEASEQTPPATPSPSPAASMRCQAPEVKPEKLKCSPQVLCTVRPRAKELFGSVISDYNYLKPTDPLKLVLTPSLAFPLRVSVLQDTGLVQIEIVDWDLDIFSGSSRIVTAALSAKLTAQISAPELTTCDPDNYQLAIRLVSEKSRVWLTEKEETNATVIPGDILLSQLRGVLQFGVDYFSKPESAMRPSIPRSFSFPEGSIFSKLGLQELSWGAAGFHLAWDSGMDRVSLGLAPIIDSRSEAPAP